MGNRVLAHDAQFACCHAGSVRPNPGTASLRIAGQPVVFTKDLESAPVLPDCKNVGLGLKQCDRVGTVGTGISRHIRVNGQSVLLETVLAATLSNPPGTCDVIEAGSSKLRCHNSSSAAGGTASASAGQRYEPTKKDRHQLTFRLVDTNGQPVAGVWFRVVIASRGTLDGVTSATGHGRVERIPQQAVNVSFPDYAGVARGPGGTTSEDFVHVVQRGDSLSRIAATFGIPSWRDLWDDPRNRQLREQRKDPNVIYPGDQVVISNRLLLTVDHLHEITLTPNRRDRFKVSYRFSENEPVAGLPVSARFANGETCLGELDAAGECVFEEVPECSVEVEIGDESDERELTELRQQLKAYLESIVAETVKRAKQIDKEHDQLGALEEGYEYAKAAGEGLYEAGESLVLFAVDAWVAVNRIGDEVRNRLFTAVIEGDLAPIRDGLQELENNGVRLRESLAALYAKVVVAISDSAMRMLLVDFAKRYVEALHPIEKTKLVGSLSFDVVIALISGGAGAAAGLLSKSRYFKPAVKLIERILPLLKRKRLRKKVSGRADIDINTKADEVLDSRIWGEASSSGKAAKTSPKPIRNPRVSAHGGLTMHGTTAGKGGIYSIEGFLRNDGSVEYVIKGEILPPLKKGPRYNKKEGMFPSAKSLGLDGYHKSHLWGPGFGDEAADGIMYAPKEVNLAYQNAGIEARLREARAVADAEGGSIFVRASARSHPRGKGARTAAQERGFELLAEAEYRVYVRNANGMEEHWFSVSVSVDPPPSGRIVIENPFAEKTQVSRF